MEVNLGSFGGIMYMISYVVISTIVTFITGKIWYVYLFPNLFIDSIGSEDIASMHKKRNDLILIISLLAVSYSFGVLFLGRGMDAEFIRFAMRVWVGLFIPLILFMWSGTQGGIRTLFAYIGYWLVVVIQVSILAGMIL